MQSKEVFAWRAYMKSSQVFLLGWVITTEIPQWCMQRDGCEEELSYSLSNLHCFLIVMSEEVIGLVRLHRFSPINSEVKYCKGTKKGSERQTCRGSEKDHSMRPVRAVTFIPIESAKPVLLRSIYMTTWAYNYKQSHSIESVDINVLTRHSLEHKIFSEIKSPCHYSRHKSS